MTERDSRRCMVTRLTDVCVLVAYRTERDSRRCMVTSLTDVCVFGCMQDRERQSSMYGNTFD